MQVQYDPTVIGAAAARLYERADGLPALYGLLGGLSMFVVLGLAAVSQGAPSNRLFNFLVGGIVGGVLGALLGWFRGRERAFFLRLEAQRMLVLVQIEANTRRGAAGQA